MCDPYFVLGAACAGAFLNLGAELFFCGGLTDYECKATTLKWAGLGLTVCLVAIATTPEWTAIYMAFLSIPSAIINRHAIRPISARIEARRLRDAARRRGVI